MKVIELTIQDMLGIELASVVPEGSLVTVGGPNGAGKTSLLDSLMVGLSRRDAKLHPMLVRKGAKRGTETIDLGDLKVHFVCRESGSYEVAVTNAEGAVYRNARDLLDGLVGPLSFDPTAWKDLPGPQMKKALMAVLGIDVDALDAKRKDQYAQRTKINDEVGALQAQLRTIDADLLDDVPDEPVDTAQRLAEIRAAQILQKAIADRNWRIQSAKESIAKQRQIIEAARAVIAAELAKINAAEAEVYPDAGAVDRTIADLEQAISTATVVNAKVAKRKQSAKLRDDLAPKLTLQTTLTASIVAIDQEKDTLLENAKWPVPGLGFSEDGVTYDGIPWIQVNEATKLRVSVAMGLGMNPKLKILLIRDGSGLDQKSLTMIAQMAEEADAQVWLEKVSDDPQSVQVFIREGRTVQQEAVDQDPVTATDPPVDGYFQMTGEVGRQ